MKKPHEFSGGYQLARRRPGEVQFLQHIEGAWQETVFAFGSVAVALAHAARENWDAWFLVAGRRTSLRQVVALSVLQREEGQTTLAMLRLCVGGSAGATLTDAFHLDAMGWTAFPNGQQGRVHSMLIALTDQGREAADDAAWIMEDKP